MSQDTADYLITNIIYPLYETEPVIHSTWGDWFVRDEIEAIDPEGVSIWYLGCNGFVLRSPTTTLYIDPYFGDGNPPFTIRMIPIPIDPSAVTMCDGVLISHEHGDHMHPPSFDPLLDTDTRVFGSRITLTEPVYDGSLPSDSYCSIVDPGAEFDVGDFTIHVRGANDPDAKGDLTYIIEHEAGTFLHPGDSRPADEFFDIGEEFDIDIGVLAFGSVGQIFYDDDDASRPSRWYMDENQVIKAANALQLHRLLPVHYDMWKSVGGDPKGLHDHATSFEFPRIIEPVTIGDRVNTSEPGIKRLQAKTQ